MRWTLTLGLSLAACSARSQCPSTRTCGAAAWIDPSSGGTPEGRMVHASMLDAVADRLSQSGSEALRVCTQPVWMRFDLSALAGAEGVERAVLSLAPHPSWRPSENGSMEGEGPRMVVRASAGVQGSVPVLLGEGIASEVTVAARARSPLRVDVTGLVRLWVAGTLPPGTLTVESSRGVLVFMGNGAARSSDRPRLEVVLR